MQAQHQSSSGTKATTLLDRNTGRPSNIPRHLVATAIIGAALIGYIVHKTPDSRIRLESLAAEANQLGELTANDAAVVAELLAKPQIRRPHASLSLV